MTDATADDPCAYIEALLQEAGELWRQAHPQPTPEEAQARSERTWNEFMARVHAGLDERGTVACDLCHHERPRRDPLSPEGYFHPFEECEKAGEPWHYRRDWSYPSLGREPAAKIPETPEKQAL